MALPAHIIIDRPHSRQSPAVPPNCSCCRPPPQLFLVTLGPATFVATTAVILSCDCCCNCCHYLQIPLSLLALLPPAPQLQPLSAATASTPLDSAAATATTDAALSRNFCQCRSGNYRYNCHHSRLQLLLQLLSLFATTPVTFGSADRLRNCNHSQVLLLQLLSPSVSTAATVGSGSAVTATTCDCSSYDALGCNCRRRP